MQFLYKWVTKGHLPNIRRGMVEDLETFLADEQSLLQAQQTAARVEAQQAAVTDTSESNE